MSAAFRILGSLEVLDGDRAVALGGLRQRALLALLLLRANEVVSTDRLIAELWGESPPPTARQTVQGTSPSFAGSCRWMAPARARSRPARPATSSRGARATRPRPVQGAVGLRPRGAGRGRRRRRGRDAPRGPRPLRGPPLADFAYEGWAQRDIARLEESRLACLEERIEADLQLGRDSDLVGELEALVEEHPLRERLRGQLMLALYGERPPGRGSGTVRLRPPRPRRRAGDRARRGAEGPRAAHPHPGPALAPSARAVAETPAVASPPPSRPRRSIALGSPRPLIALGASVLAVTAGLGTWLAVRGGDGASPAIPGDSIALIDPRSGRADAPIDVGGSPSHLAVTTGAVWVGDVSGGALKRIDPEAGAVVETIPLDGGPDSIAAGGDPSGRPTASPGRWNASALRRTRSSRPSPSPAARAASPTATARSGWRAATPGRSRESTPRAGG